MTGPASTSLHLVSATADNHNDLSSSVLSELRSDYRKEAEVNKPSCKICKRNVTRRVNRQGFLQRVIFYKLGYAPWECVFCRKPFLYPAK